MPSQSHSFEAAILRRLILSTLILLSMCGLAKAEASGQPLFEEPAARLAQRCGPYSNCWPRVEGRDCKTSLLPSTTTGPLESPLFGPPQVTRPLIGPPLLRLPPVHGCPPDKCPPPSAPGYMASPFRFGIASPVPPAVVSAHAPPWEQLPTQAELKGKVMRATPHRADCRSSHGQYSSGDFTPDPFYNGNWEVCQELGIYGNKRLNPVQRPAIEWGLPFYLNGPIPRSETWLGKTNLVQPKFYVYGDYRSAMAYNDFNGNDQSIWANRLNLDIDLWITSTERFHMFWGPLDERLEFTSLVYDNGEVNRNDAWDGWDQRTDTMFFEGDLGYILGGLQGIEAPFDLPFAVGLIPLVYQNGIWIEDAFVGAAMTIPARNNPTLDWSNFDTTVFVGFDEVTNNQAFNNDNRAANIVGVTTQIERRGGYFEFGYAFLDDDEQLGRSFHSIGASYTRRYLNLLSNSVRTLVNTGQDGPRDLRPADGVLVLVENSFLTRNPYNVIPYANFFAGFGTPRSAARLQGPLKNTGINFESDLLTGYPLLDDTGNNTYGGAIGVDLLGWDFEQQLILEFAFLQAFDDAASRAAPGDQYAAGIRYQKPLSHTLIFRADAMHGWLENAEDISGARMELRRKF